ncbi:ATP-grasp domain-containing protein [Luteipulveratus mongoliensis]|uniref:Siderophore biosynthesis protein n=1 Tax=Luteipulveratus mongoliensis TaxID=571913 RepID=A0A0K1JNF3_9MICO|nr:ATP-grasp domain-containing protein [Luteipulveratus mongoliensis]AKU18237.1 siderophore biosynthesis protein [Luteipulveratus mongoliensis]
MSAQIAVLATTPTDSNTEGFLPAAVRRGAQVILLTAYPEVHRAAYAGTPLAEHVTVVECRVEDHREALTALAGQRVAAVFSGSDHLQMQTALVADFLGLPGKDWRVAWRVKNKALMREHLAAAGVDKVWSLQLRPDDPIPLSPMPFPVVVKPREGVASEDVELCSDERALATCVSSIRRRRPGAVLVVEEFLPGELRTLETLGDGERRHVLGGFCTELGKLPYFIEERMHFDPAPDPEVVAQVLTALDALGVGFGICHTEFVVHEGRARLIEVNYRAIGDQCDLMLPDLIDVPIFDLALGVHCGEALPEALPTRTDGRARLEYLCARRSGTLVRAPGSVDRVEDGVTLAYRPLRELGVTANVTMTNRDFLGVVRARGLDQARVDAVVAGFVADNEWRIA